MKYNLKREVLLPYITTINGIINEAGNGFGELTGYCGDEIMGKSLCDLKAMLKINCDIESRDIEKKHTIYIFTRELNPKEVVVFCEHESTGDRKKYIFIEKSGSRLGNKLHYAELLLEENKTGIAIRSFPDLVLLKANQKYLDFMEPPFNRPENSIGVKLSDMLSGFKGSEADKMWTKVIETMKPAYVSDFKYEGFAKGITYWDLSIMPILIDERPKYIVESAAEVTERVVNRFQMVEQNKQLEAIIENMSDALIIFDKEGNFKKLNKAARDVYPPITAGLDKIGEVYKSVKIFDDRGNTISYENIPALRVINGETILGCRVGLKAGEEVVFSEINGTPVYDEDGNFSVGVLCIHDVTKGVNYEAKLRQQSEFLNKVLHTLDFPVIRLSYPQLKIKYINKKAYRMLKGSIPGINSIDSMTGLSYEILAPDVENAFVKEHIEHMVLRNEISFSRFREMSIDGEERYLNIIYQPIFNSNNDIEEIICLAIDITNEVNANKVMERTINMQEEFFINISHELKTPLNVIFATVQLFKMYCSNGSLDEKKDLIKRHIDSIMQNSYRLSKLINNIVDLSKIEAGFFELNLSNNNIIELVEETVTSVVDYTNSKNINIVFDTDMEEKVIACDPEKVERILLNLISNAIKFSGEGSEIHVNIHDRDEYVEIIVEDEGIGIDPLDLDYIFERFKQVDRSLTRKAEGTGIGLSLVKSIVELHKGSIYVESEPGKGSKFTVLLPAKKTVKEDSILSSRLRNKGESIRAELSDI